MRFYDPEKQILAMLFAQLLADAEKNGQSPADLFTHALLRMTKRHRGELRLPEELCDPSRSSEERYTWLCDQMELFHEQESMRRAEWRMATEQAGCSVLDCMLDDPALPQTCQLLREDGDTVLLAFEANEALVDGFRLQNACVQGGFGIPVLMSSIELIPSLAGGLTLMAMSANGEVQVTFSGAERVTLFYDYSCPADPVSVLLLPPVRLAYGLSKLLQKALRKEKTPLTEAEEKLLPLALASTLFCGKTESLEMAEELSAACGNTLLSRLRYIFPVAVRALRDCAADAGDEKALRLLSVMGKKGTADACARTIRRFGDHCATADGEALVRTALARLTEAAASYPPSPLSGVRSDSYAVAKETVDRVMAERGYVGCWPRYRKEHILTGARLFCVEGIYPHVARTGRRVVSTVDCTAFLQGETLCVRFASGTVLLQKKEDGGSYPDGESAAFSQKGNRRIQQFAAGLVLREEDRLELLDLAQTAVCAAKSAELEDMSEEERLRVVHASRRPAWVAALLWLVHGIGCGVAVGLLALLIRGICSLLGAEVLAPLAPLWIGMSCGGGVFLGMLLLTLIGRRRL